MRGGDEDALSPARRGVAPRRRSTSPGIVQVGCSIRDVRAAVAMAERAPGDPRGDRDPPQRGAAPGRAGASSTPRIAEVEQLAAGSPRVRGIGETGLDYFRTRRAEGWAIQEESFRAHIDLARRLGRALVIHDRDSHDDVIRVLLDEPAGAGLPDVVVFHCFSGDARDGAGRRRARLVRVVRRDGHVHQRPRPARRRAGRAARPDPRRDRRAVPDARRRTAAGSTPATWCR